MPLGLVLIGTKLKQAGHEVTVKDFLLPAQVMPAQAPASFAGTHNPPYRHYGMPLKECQAWLTDHANEYDVIGMNMGQCNVWETGAALGTYITRVLRMPLVIGGPFVTTAPQEALELTNADVAVIGEGENKAEAAFILARENAPCKVEVRGTPCTEWEIPLPDWSLAPPANYPTCRGRVRGVLTVSRGCPNGCTFCSVHTIMGRRCMQYPYERIVLELKNLQLAYGVRYFSFLDDNLLLSADRANDVLDAVQAVAKPGDRFYMEEGMEVRVAAVPGIVARLKALRFDNIAIGMETMNPEQRQLIDKPYNEQHLTAALDNFKQAGVTAKAFYIIGLPGDTLTSVCKDIVRFGKLGLAARPNNLKLYPGTHMTFMYQQTGWVAKDYDWRMSSYYTPPSIGLTFEQIRKLKTILGAVGAMAEAHGIRLLADNMDDITEAFGKGKGGYKLQLEGGNAILTGNFYRPTPYIHALGILLMRRGAKGYAVQDTAKHQLFVASYNVPLDDIQEALGNAIKEAI